MSVTGIAPSGTATAPDNTAAPVHNGLPSPNPRRVLLVWDAPNLDMGLGAILGGRPTAAHRPRFDALGRWLLARTAQLSAQLSAELSVPGQDGPTATLEPEATVFTNIAQGSADVVRPWVEALRNVGFAVFAKPKVDEGSDVDADMLSHIALRRLEGLAGILVA
jgi:putative heme uptake system protein